MNAYWITCKIYALGSAYRSRTWIPLPNLPCKQVGFYGRANSLIHRSSYLPDHIFTDNQADILYHQKEVWLLTRLLVESILLAQHDRESYNYNKGRFNLLKVSSARLHLWNPRIILGFIALIYSCEESALLFNRGILFS